MRFFRRRNRRDEPAEADSAPEGSTDLATSQTPGADASAAAAESNSDGPWDIADMPDVGTRVDVGALRIPARKGMQVRMELEPKTRRIVSVNISLDGSALQLQAFAAPRSEQLWEVLQAEITESITNQGGTVTEARGEFGAELHARLPVRTKDGRSGHRPARFIGIDGPRWFLRGVLTGPAARDEDAGAMMEAIIADVVVVRGSDPKAPRDLLPLHLPGKPGEVQAPEPERPVVDLDQGRGPEITEVG